MHTESCPAFIGLRKRTMLGGPLPPIAVLMHRIADALADSFYPELERVDDRVDELERLVLGDRQEDVLAEVLGLRRRLVFMRRVLGPQRDVVARLASGHAWSSAEPMTRRASASARRRTSCSA